ncbi:hypothetical protein REPUB_Repub04eG0084400 [Reevesia pubescens]
MDAFYAAVETLSNPSLKGKLMAVDSMSMIFTANYEARKFGVRAVMPGFIVLFWNNDPDFMAASFDEAYLDITEVCKARGISGGEIAEELRSRVHEETNLTCSAGVTPNRLLDEVLLSVLRQFSFVLFVFAADIAEMLSADMQKEGLFGRTLTLKLKTASFEVHTRAVTLQKYICSSDDILKYASKLLKAELPISLRLIAMRHVTMSLEIHLTAIIYKIDNNCIPSENAWEMEKTHEISSNKTAAMVKTADVIVRTPKSPKKKYYV